MVTVTITPPSPEEESRRAISNAAILHRQAVEREWGKSELGDLFLKYENLTARAWQVDSNPNVSYKNLKTAWERAEGARRNFLTALRGF